MTVQNQNGADDRIVVGYFRDGADAYRAINELIDEGFRASEIGAAFRASLAEAGRLDKPAAIGGVQELAARNPATTGSVGGVASHDEAVTPAGLAPGSGNAFPAPAGPGPIPGGEIPSTLKHDLPHDLPTEAQVVAGSARREEGIPVDEGWRKGLHRIFSEGSENSSRRSTGGSSIKFGTGEGHLFAEGRYSEPAFENSFVGMGLGASEARSLSGELARGGAVVSVTPSDRASLAEAIIERNHGRLRFELAAHRGEVPEDSRVELYGRMRNYYRREEDLRKAS